MKKRVCGIIRSWEIGFVLLSLVFPACGPKKLKPSPQALKLVRQAAQWLRGGDPNRAEAAYSLALEYRPKMAEAHNGLGLVALKRGERRRAIRCFEKALSFNEDLAEAHNNLGVIYYREGRYKRSHRHLISALAVDPGYGVARGNLVRTLLKMGRLDKARDHLVKITAQSPRDAGAWAQLALVCISLNRRAQAGRAVDRALELDPKLAAAHRARGRLLQRGGHHRRAVKALKVALRHDSSDWQSRHYLGLSLLILGRVAQGFRTLTQVAARHPGHAEVQFALAFAQVRLGRYHAALKRLKITLASHPRHKRGRYLLAVCLRALGRESQAVRIFKSLRGESVPKGLRRLASSALRSKR